MRNHDLSQSQFLIMMMIYREPDCTSLTPGEIADRMDVSKPVLSRAFATLAEKGMTKNAKSASNDKRSREIALTPAGLALFRQFLPQYLGILQAADL